MIADDDEEPQKDGESNLIDQKVEIEEEEAEEEEIIDEPKLKQIEEIKIKWNSFIKMKKKNYLEDYSVLK